MILMKFKPVLKIIILMMAICGFSFKTRAQQLASQKPLSSVYSQRVKDWLAVNKPRPQLSSLQAKRNLPSVRPLPRKATESKMKYPSLNANLSNEEKIKKLPSKSTLTVHQIADRRPAGRKPTLR
jgi:hypothetical protein